MTSTISLTPDWSVSEPSLPSNTPDAPNSTRTTSENDYFNIAWSEALKGLPPALSAHRSIITHAKITLSSPPEGLLFKRRLWNRETDHGRLCDANGWQGSLANQQRLEAQRQINEEWLGERNLMPVDVSVFGQVEWKNGATMFEVQVSPKTILIEGEIVEAPCTQAVEAHGSLNNSRRYHARIRASQRWKSERGESPIPVDTLTAVNWYMGSSQRNEHQTSSPRGTAYVLPEADTARYERSGSTSSISGTQCTHASPWTRTSTDSLSSFADLISKYNRSSEEGSRSPGSSIGITRRPHSSPGAANISPLNSLTFDHEDHGEEPSLQTVSIALVISRHSSKASMLGTGHASQARRSPRRSETFGMSLSQDERLAEVLSTQSIFRGPLSPEVRLVVIGGKAMRQRQHDITASESEPKWFRISLLRTPTVAEQTRCGFWERTKGMFGKLNCRGVSSFRR